jgi:hypothetical protein
MNTVTTLAGTAGRITRAAAAGVIWVYRNTDWTEVWETVLQGLKVLVVLTLLAGRLARRWWDALPGWSEQLGQWYADRITPPDHVIDMTGMDWHAPVQFLPVPAYMPAAVPARVEVRQQLEGMTCRQLRDLTGIRRKMAKRQLIELALAA